MTYARRALSILLILMILVALPAQGSLAETDAAETGLLTGLNLSASAAVVLDADTGRVIYGKNPHRKARPASTTKVMTLLLALEYGHLDDEIVVPAEAKQIPAGSSVVPVAPGDKLSFRDLLYGMMLNSGNDAANAVAVIVSGSLDAFVARMNERAREIGCTDTHFANAHGYDQDDHYTTAYDLALIAREAMRDETFREIVSTLTYTLTKLDTKATRRIKTSNMMQVPSSAHYYAPMIGVKTGTTSKSGSCFIGAAEDKGKRLISTVLHSTSSGRWDDTRALMEGAYSLYELYTFDDLYALYPQFAPVQNAHAEDPAEILLVPQNGAELYSITCLPDEAELQAAEINGRVSIRLNGELRAPIEQNEQVGTLIYTPPGGAPVTVPLVAGQSVRAAPRTWLWFVPGVLVVLILAFAGYVAVRRGWIRIGRRRRGKARGRR